MPNKQKYFYRSYEPNAFRCTKCRNRYVGAMLKFTDDGEQIIVLGQREHTCQQPREAKKSMSNSNGKKSQSNVHRIIKQDRFKLFANENGIPNSKLEVTFDDGRKYIYNYRGRNNFTCPKCRKLRGLYVGANFRPGGAGRPPTVLLSKSMHICDSNN